MHRFVLVRTKSEWATSNIARRFATMGVDMLPFEPQKISARRLSKNTFLFSAEAGDYFSTGGYTSFTESGALAFSGVPFGLPKGRWAEHLHALVNRDGLMETFEQIAGQFHAVHFDATTGAITAHSDFSGSWPLFHSHNKHVFAISNRQFLLNPLCVKSDRPTFDSFACSWGVSQWNHFGIPSPINNIKLLTPGSTLTFRQYPQISEPDASVWQAKTSHNVPEEIFDDAANALIGMATQIKAVAQQPLALSLTGGKDSRLVLAMARAAGIDREVEIFTTGHEGHPDILAAANVCQSLGLSHKAHITHAPGAIPADRVWHKVAASPFRFEGTLSAFGPAPNTTTAVKSVELCGILAEIYKRVWPKYQKVQFQSADEARRRLVHFQGPNDEFDLLHDEHINRQREVVGAWVDKRLDGGTDISNLLELYYLENRLTWWGGVTNQTNLARIRIAALGHRAVARAAFMMPIEDRSNARLHYELIKRAAPELLNHPLANCTWPADLIEKHPNLPSKPFQVPKTAPQKPVWWQAHFLRENATQVKDYVLSDPNSRIFDVVRREPLIRFLDQLPQTNSAAQMKVAFGLLMLQTMFSHSYSKQRDQLGYGRVLDTNIPEIRHILPI